MFYYNHAPLKHAGYTVHIRSIYGCILDFNPNQKPLTSQHSPNPGGVPLIITNEYLTNVQRITNVRVQQQVAMVNTASLN